MAEVPDAEVTIVGGGAIGCAVAYYYDGLAADAQGGAGRPVTRFQGS